MATKQSFQNIAETHKVDVVVEAKKADLDEKFELFVDFEF